MAGTLCIDFDDTLVEGEIFERIMDAFAAPRWRDLREERRAGRMTVEELCAAALDLVEADESELRAMAREVAKPRAGLMELTDWAHWNGWNVAVVSNGFDFYIDPVLDALGLERVSRHCGRTRFAYRWRVSYVSPRGVELQSGFKVSYASAYKQAGDFVAWVGDGDGDVAPAGESDAVFARGRLWDTLKDGHARIYPFETFHDVTAVLDREGARWLESFSSTTVVEG
jgi:2-hydroxy-3-keto-5-methylthiopentenyl-1-phosphate phosphatase